jgi:hypothetical protein
MNVDYVLNMTPAMARKLKALSQVAQLNIEESLFAPADEGLLTIESASERLPESLRKYLNPTTLRVMQYSEDHDCRWVLGVRSFAQASAYALMASLVGNNKVLVVIKPGIPKELELWRAFLKSHQLAFGSIRTPDDDVDNDAMILISNAGTLTGPILNKLRHRTLITIDSASNAEHSFDSVRDFSMDDLFGEKSILNWVGCDLVSEFPKAIATFFMNPNSQLGQPVRWWDHSIVRNIVDSVLPGLQCRSTLSMQASVRSELSNLGFTTTTPNHIAPVIGVNVDILVNGAT